MNRFIITLLFSLLNLHTICAYESPVSIIDFEKDASITYYKKVFAEHEYTVYDYNQLFGKGSDPKKSYSFNLYDKGYRLYGVEMWCSEKSNLVFTTNIEGKFAKDRFIRALVDFYKDITNKYGQPDSAYYRPDGYVSSNKQLEYIPVNDIAEDTTTIKQFFEQAKPFGLLWRKNGFHIDLIVDKKYNVYYEPNFHCTIKNCKLYDAYLSEKEAIEQEEQAKAERDKLINTIAIIVAIPIVIFFAVIIIKGFRKSRAEEKIRRKAEEAKRAIKQKAVDDEHEKFLNDLIGKYGVITRTISKSRYDDEFIRHYDDILVFEKPKKIWFGKTEYNFDDILSCSLYDENKKDVPPVQVTRTKTGSMLGRAAIGGLTLGVAGAVVGAMTAKTESKSSFDSLDHIASYIIKVGIKSIENPTITLRFGGDKNEAENVYAVMQAIIAMK